MPYSMEERKWQNRRKDKGMIGWCFMWIVQHVGQSIQVQRMEWHVVGCLSTLSNGTLKTRILAEQLSKACKADIFTRDPKTVLAEHRERTELLNTVTVRHVRNVPAYQNNKLGSTLRKHMEWMNWHVNSFTPEKREAAEP